MEVDNTITEVIIKISRKNKIELTKALDIMDSFYRGLYTTIAEKKADVIKIPYFGKFMYNEDYKKKKEKTILEFRELKFGIK